VIIPEDAGLAVLKGAVQFRFNPKVINPRINRFLVSDLVYFSWLTSFHMFPKSITTVHNMINNLFFLFRISSRTETLVCTYSIGKAAYSWIDRGVKVDKAFDEFLLDIVGMETMGRFQNEDKADYLSLCREFEVKKRGIRLNNYVCIGNRCLSEYSTEMLNNLLA
jgi:hypothetical protein